MKRQKFNVLWVFIACITLLAPSVSWADVVSGTSTFRLFNYSPGDMSVTYLGQIFGNVGSVLAGSGSSLLGLMAGYLNTLLMMFASLMAGYATLLGLINTANEGEFLGKKLSSVWLPIRITLSITLLIPTSSGYCVIQILMMYIILQGVGLADTMTSKIATYFQSGNTLYSTSSYADSSDYADTVQHLFAALVCQQSAYLSYPDGNDSIPAVPTPDISKITGSSNPYFTYTFNEAFNDTGGTIPCGKVKVKLNNYQIPSDKNTTIAGTSYTKEQMAGVIQIKAMNDIMGTLNKVAYYYVNQDVDDEEDDDYDSRNKATVQLVGTNFLTTMEQSYYSYQQQAANMVYNTSAQAYSDYYNYMRAYGWLTLGSVFFVFTTNTATTQNLEDGFNIDKYNSDDPTDGSKDYNKDAKAGYDFIGNWSDYMDSVNSTIDNISVDSGINTSSHGFGATLWDIPTYKWGGMTFGGKAKITSAVSNLIKKAINKSMKDFISALNYSNDNIDVNPLIVAAGVGNKLMTLAGKIWTAYITIMVVAAVWMGVGACLSSLWLVLIAAITLISPILFFLVGIFITVGGALGVLLPMMPFIIFSLAVVVWFVFCIEAMFGIPFAAAGLAWPEAHEVWGKAEPALMLAVSVFLRPALIIISFIAALILSYVACSVVNFGFGTILALLTSNLAAGVIEMYMIMMLYVGLYIAIVNEAFTIVSVFPDRVLRWVQGGEGAAASTRAKDAMGKIEQGFEKDAAQGAKAGAEAMGQSAKEGGKGVMEKVYKDREDERQKAKGLAKKDDTGSSEDVSSGEVKSAKPTGRSDDDDDEGGDVNQGIFGPSGRYVPE